MLFLSGVMCFSLSRDMTELTLLLEGGQQTTTHPCWAQTPGAAERFSYEVGEPGPLCARSQATAQNGDRV